MSVGAAILIAQIPDINNRSIQIHKQQTVGTVSSDIVQAPDPQKKSTKKLQD